MGDKTRNWILTGIVALSFSIMGYMGKLGVESITGELKNINTSIDDFSKAIAVQEKQGKNNKKNILDNKIDNYGKEIPKSRNR